MFTEKEIHVINHLLTLTLQNRKLQGNPDKISCETVEIANKILNKIIWGVEDTEEFRRERIAD